MHSVFYHGTVEWRLFNSTLHAGEAKANIILAMAISAQGINQKYTQFHKTPIGDNPAFTFRTFLLRLGLIGPEYKNVRMHLLKNLPGDKAFRKSMLTATPCMTYRPTSRMEITLIWQKATLWQEPPPTARLSADREKST